MYHELSFYDRCWEMPWEETKEYIRSGHESTDDYDKTSFRTITLDEEKGIKGIVGCKKGHYEENKCTTSMHIISYLFAKEKGWTMSDAQAWFDNVKK